MGGVFDKFALVLIWALVPAQPAADGCVEGLKPGNARERVVLAGLILL